MLYRERSIRGPALEAHHTNGVLGTAAHTRPNMTALDQKNCIPFTSICSQNPSTLLWSSSSFSLICEVTSKQ